MRWCWMTWFRKGKCSRLPAQHNKMTFDKRVCAYRGNTENGSIRKWAKLAGWLINSQFSQVVRSSRVEATITERREFVLYPWTNGQPMRRSVVSFTFKKLSGQGEQLCSEPSVVCLDNTHSVVCWIRTPQWGAADTKIKAPSVENTELKGSLFKAWSRSMYSQTSYAYCQGFLPC